MDFPTLSNEQSNFYNKHTIIYGRVCSGKTEYVKTITEVFSPEVKIMYYTKETKEEVEKFVNNRYNINKEKNNIEYCNKAIELLGSQQEAIESLNDRKFESIERLDQFNIFEINDNNHVLIINDDYSSSTWSDILFKSRFINISIIMTAQTSKLLTPSERSLFHNSLFLDKENLNTFVSSLSNLCVDSIRETAKILINNNNSRIALVKKNGKREFNYINSFC